jgi:hypothetical protein
MKPKHNKPDETKPSARELQDNDAPPDTRFVPGKSAAACRQRRAVRVVNPKFRWRVRTTNWTSRASH